MPANLKYDQFDIIFIEAPVQIKDVNECTYRKTQQPKELIFEEIAKKALQITSLFWVTKWRGVRDLNPRGPKDHRLSRLRLQFCPFGRL